MPRRNREPEAVSYVAWEQLWQIFCPWVTGTDDIQIEKPTRIKRAKNTRPKIAKLVFAGMTCLALAGISPAQAIDLKDGNFINVSLTKEPETIQPHYPSLFGKSETRYTNLQPFTKWSGVLQRFADTFQDSLKYKETQKWLAFIQKQRDLDPMDQIEAVNTYLNKIPFISDQENYDVGDYWATPMEFLRRGGDCEDYAISKYVSLRALGFHEDQMRVAIVYDTHLKMPHAVLIVYQSNQALVLDNQAEDIKSADAVKQYFPIYSINQYAWWRH